MSDHKPECPMRDEQWPKHPLEVCEYCDMIAACEQRVLDALDLAGANVKYQRIGFAAGLDAAREAVGALPTSLTKFGTTTIMESVDKAAAIAAIDALKEKP